MLALLPLAHVVAALAEVGWGGVRELVFRPRVAELHYFRNSDPGAFLSVSGAGVLASSDQPEEAQQLVAYLTGPEAQQRLAESTALEYAVGNGVASAEVLPPLAELQAPQVDPGSLDQQRVTELMQDVGLL